MRQCPMKRAKMLRRRSTHSLAGPKGADPQRGALGSPSGWLSDECSLQEVITMNHEEFAQRAARRLEAVADRTEEETRRLGIDGEVSGTKARAQEMRVAAFLVREEALAVSERGRGTRRRFPEGPSRSPSA